MTSINFTAINNAARAGMPGLLSAWVPGGRRHGREWVGRNPRRADRTPGSFSINMDSGRWSDFATGDAGGDFVSLFAYLRGVGQGEAARELARQFSLDAAESVADVASVAGGHSNSEGSRGEGWTPIIPVPVEAPKLTRGEVSRVKPAGYVEGDCHVYRTADGAVFGAVVRLHGPIANDGKPAKTFRPFVFCENADGKRQWRCQGLPEPRPLYGLHLLAQRPESAALIVEGEATAMLRTLCSRTIAPPQA